MTMPLRQSPPKPEVPLMYEAPGLRVPSAGTVLYDEHGRAFGRVELVFMRQEPGEIAPTIDIRLKAAERREKRGRAKLVGLAKNMTP